jgi:hypothetical protein
LIRALPHFHAPSLRPVAMAVKLGFQGRATICSRQIFVFGPQAPTR